MESKHKTQYQEEWEKIMFDVPFVLNKKQIDDIYRIGFATAIDTMYSIVEKHNLIDKETLDVFCNLWDINDFSMTYYLNLAKRREWQK